MPFTTTIKALRRLRRAARAAEIQDVPIPVPGAGRSLVECESLRGLRFGPSCFSKSTWLRRISGTIYFWPRISPAWSKTLGSGVEQVAGWRPRGGCDLGARLSRKKLSLLQHWILATLPEPKNYRHSSEWRHGGIFGGKPKVSHSTSEGDGHDGGGIGGTAFGSRSLRE